MAHTLRLADLAEIGDVSIEDLVCNHRPTRPIPDDLPTVRMTAKEIAAILRDPEVADTHCSQFPVSFECRLAGAPCA